MVACGGFICASIILKTFGFVSQGNCMQSAVLDGLHARLHKLQVLDPDGVDVH